MILWPLHVRAWWRTLRRELPPADLYHAFGILTVSVALDLSGRPYLLYDVDPGGGAEAYPLGSPPFDPQLAEEFWRAFVTAARITLHVRRREGKNTHHVVEATFKAVARALRDAVRVEGSRIPSTKGAL